MVTITNGYTVIVAVSFETAAYPVHISYCAFAVEGSYMCMHKHGVNGACMSSLFSAFL